MEQSQKSSDEPNQYTASQLLTQLQIHEESKSASSLEKTDPVAFLERELKIKFTAEERE